jgi:hypothetical protein
MSLNGSCAKPNGKGRYLFRRQKRKAALPLEAHRLVASKLSLLFGLFLLVVLFSRIALLAHFFVLGRFDAAFVLASLAGFLGVIAATGLETGCSGEPDEGAGKKG